METYDNQHVIIPNNKVVQGVITNYTANPTRRAVVKIKLNKAREVILDVVKKDPRILADPTPSVVVSDIDEFAMTLAVRCYSKNRDYWDVLYATQENVIVALRDNGFHFPERKVTIDK